jgi:hypothetical protein
MPVELTAFTADLRITGAIPLTDDRLSDMLNSVARIVIRGAVVEDLVNEAPAQTANVTLTIGSIVAVLATGQHGLDARRRRTDTHPARVGLTRFVVSGALHLPAGVEPRGAGSSQPSVVLAGRDVLVPLTDATISYDRADVSTSERCETILINRAHASWIDLEDTGGNDDDFISRPQVYHAAISRDATRAT